MPEMAPEAMELLSSEVRRLRVLLEEDIRRTLDRRFRLSVPMASAHLGERERRLRKRLEEWLDERRRAGKVAAMERTGPDVMAASTSEAAANLFLRLVLLKQLEASGVVRPPVLTGGWSSKGYLELRTHGPELVHKDGPDDYEGLDFLLKLVFDDLSVDLPGLYGERPLDPYFTLSPAALREVIAALNAPALGSAWLDDTTLGWVYQFWNDPTREAIDERVGPRGKVAPHEIASKTQLFTEQYMVEWLLENSVGRIVVGMRQRRQKSFSGDQTAPPPWPMFVRDASELSTGLPARLEELKILDPACGSGHFLAGAFDLLVPLYREEARDEGRSISDEEIASSILRHNLHGIDIDARAVQVAAAVLYLKARKLASKAPIPSMNLIATAFDLDGLAGDDPALTALASALPHGMGNLEEAVRALRYVGFRGSLLRLSRKTNTPLLFDELDPSAAIETILQKHARADDLGVRFDGLQLAAGLRLKQLLTEGRYDVVVFNPPYLATSKIDLPPAVLAEAFGHSPDLFASFVERALELCKPTGLIAFVALANWMFLASFIETRERILKGHILLLADVGKGAFRRASKLIQTAMAIASPGRLEGPSLAARVGSRDVISATQVHEIARSLQDPSNYKVFDAAAFTSVEGAPLLYWLEPAFLRRYVELPKIDDVGDGQGGIATGDNERFLRAVWEVPPVLARRAAQGEESPYLPYLKGAEGREWIEPYRWVLRAAHAGLELRLASPAVRLARAVDLGVAYTTIGHRFGARLHTVKSVRDVSGASIFPTSKATANALVCALNRTAVRDLASALNPTVNFQLGDVRRLPFDKVEGDAEIVATLHEAFESHEKTNELSLHFQRPGPSTWKAAQAWAQEAVDRPRGAPLAAAPLEREDATPFEHISYALGVALGRFSPGGGLAADSASGLPNGILFLGPNPESLAHPACDLLLQTWQTHGAALSKGDDLANYLRRRFFQEHRSMYEGRPIYWPLSSAGRSYVAYMSFHHLRAATMNTLLAEHLVHEKRRVEGELADLRDARVSGPSRGSAEKRAAEVQKLLEELNEFAAMVTQIAEKGPPAPDGKTHEREVDAPYQMDLDDGILVNSAALWPLLDPQWKEPKKWWKELANAQGKKNCDWSHLAARYFPKRVREKCQADPSLAVAHGSVEAQEILAKERLRREKSGSREKEHRTGPLFDRTKPMEEEHE
ncbi:MAG: SAM-dependent methyltransferase [Polyangiaceae bacterium]|nr:SAM-dependent methyltransferase [Polyangiaceae bacterium]